MSKEKTRFAFYTLSHPIDGFYDIRHFGKGSLALAMLFLFLGSVSYSLNRQYASFIVNDANPLTLNSLIDLLSIFSIFFLFCIGNWSITTLMEGEGRFSDIVVSTAYAIMPVILIFLPATLFSHFIAADEEAFYYMMIGLAVGWMLLLLFLGNMTVHNYSFSKALATIVLTIIAMLIILFLLMLLFSLMQQIYSFFSSLYTEIIFRR
ncbi:MAG TPA: DUF1282 family protein [Candidatus Jeotgalibaca merdavium]|uniref:DUF1282 family protein n=1 Tax=Candidatus Jeotgalibaca merdavium TaxID=2838627 RepID=A0A9D2KYS9_9LACT|nr:DUF1282 family protein [Candidatus Jeotgalibaca merdavium]